MIDKHLEIDLYCKPTDCHQFLDFSSVHYINIQKSTVYSSGLRIKRLCSSNVAFENHLESLKDFFQNRVYPKRLVDNQLKSVTEARQRSYQTYKKGNGAPLVITLHPRLKNIVDII